MRREPSQARSRALVEALLTASDQLLRTLGDERQVTIERIISRAGVSLASFYEYFTDKDALVGALVERATKDNFENLLAQFDAAAPATLEEAFALLSGLAVETYLAHPARTRLWVMGIGRLQLTKMITTERDRFARELARRAVRFLPERAERDVVAAMVAICDATIGIVLGELYRAEPRPRSEVTAMMVQIAIALAS